MKNTNPFTGAIILMALPSESQGLLEAAGAPVHFCGIGKINATMMATSLILKLRPPRILNLGTAGSQKFAAGQLVECSSFVQRDMDLSAVGFPLGKTPMDETPDKIEVPTLTDLPKGLCGSGDLVEVGTPRLACDLVDMEAYAIAKVCKKLDVAFTSIKFITDSSDSETFKDWRQHLHSAAQSLHRIYLELSKNS